MRDRRSLQALIWAALYLASVVLVAFAHTHAGAPLWYAPVAVGVGMLLRGGLRWWVLILGCEVVTAVAGYGHPAEVVLGVALPGALETLTVAYVIRWADIRLSDADAALRLSLLGLGAAVCAASLGLVILSLLGTVPDATGQWFGWWLGDVTAMATLLPLVLAFTWHRDERTPSSAGRAFIIEALTLLVLEAVVVVVTAVSSSIDPYLRDEVRFVWAIPILWAAVRRDLLTTSIVTATMGAVATLAFSEVAGSAEIVDRIGLQSTLIAVSLAGVSVAIAVGNRRRAAAEVQATLTALVESEHRYATLFERSPVVQLLTDPANATVVDANNAAEAFYGYPLDTLRGMPVSNLSMRPSEDIQTDMRDHGRAGIHLVDTSRLASGETRNTDVVAGPITLDGRPLLHAVIRDVTDEIRARSQIAQLAGAVESSADAVITTDLAGIVTSWNGAAERLYGHSRADAIGQPIDGLVGPLALAAPELERLVQTEGVARFGNVSRTNAAGDVVPVDLVVTQILDDDGTLVGLCRVAHDLRDLLAEQERVRRSEALLADAARIGGVGSWEADPATGETIWSGELYRLTGLTPDSPVTSGSLLALVHPDDRATVAAALGGSDGAHKPVEFRLVTADGRERSMVATWRVVPASGSLAGRSIGVVRDVTEEKALETQLRQAQRLESIGLLAGGVAHDFNNLLTAIAGFTDLARVTAADGLSPEADLVEIQAAVDRAKSLTSQLLTFGRRAIVRPRPVRLAGAVGGLVPMLRRLIGERIVITTDIDAAAVAQIDPGQLDQVLVNLVVNARDAMPNGGRLQITAGVHDGDDPRTVWLEVADNGTGIAPDVMDQLFLPFFTTKERGKGTGLGLSTVQGIVEAHGGHISVTSTVGQGTVFRIQLPAADAAPEPPADDVLGLRRVDTGKVVLLVEDEELVRQAAARILERAGFEVVTAPDIPRALAKAANVRPDVLVTDIVLPGPMDGISFAEILIERWPGLPVLLMTGYTDRTPPAWAELLAKPFTGSDLVAAVQHVLALGARPAADEARQG